MLAKLAPKFVISRVIQHAYYAQSMSIAVLEQPFGIHQDYFAIHDSKKYYQCKFYGFIAKQAKPNDFANRYEEEAYNEACEKLRRFTSVHDAVQQVADFTQELRILYNVVEIQNSNGNLMTHHNSTSKIFQADVLDALERYNKFMDAIEDKPEWKEKVTQEIGKWFHLIHNNLAQSQAKQSIFLRMVIRDSIKEQAGILCVIDCGLIDSNFISNLSPKFTQ